jgi:hypothetical protein
MSYPVPYQLQRFQIGGEMAFNVREVTIHLSKAQAPCMPASPDPACPGGSCKPTNNKPDDKPDKPGGGKKRNLAALLAQLRATLAPSPL